MVFFALFQARNNALSLIQKSALIHKLLQQKMQLKISE